MSLLVIFCHKFSFIVSFPNSLLNVIVFHHFLLNVELCDRYKLHAIIDLLILWLISFAICDAFDSL